MATSLTAIKRLVSAFSTSTVTSNTVVKGVLLSGVKADSPAEKAGLKGGDIIVLLGGQTIENIYDYTAVLGVIKIGQPVEIVVLRGTERLSFMVTPAARG